MMSDLQKEQQMGTEQGVVHETVYVDRFIDGILDPNRPMLGPVRDGGHIVANTAPGCWGPMITPELRGGHEVTQPVAVAGAEVGDAIAIRIKAINVTSQATSSGNDKVMEGRFLGDPYVAGQCPECGTLYPKTIIKGIGQTAVRCAKCGADATPFNFTNGYTIAFNENRTVGVTLHQEATEAIARESCRYAALPENSIQNPGLTFAPHDLVGLVARMRPFMGQLGTTPGVPIPDSHNAGDFGAFLVGAPHEYALTAEQLELRTDGHMDIDAVRAGAILICPVKTPGGGVYLGDMHALQGDGEIAGHTCDVSGTVTLQVHLLKGLNLDGPILFPVAEDLPFLARPLSDAEWTQAQAMAKTWGVEQLEKSAPISVIGTGPDLNAATDNGLKRAAELLNMTVPEVKNRATITGAVEIGRHPGVVQITFRAPLGQLARKGLRLFIRDQYGI
ncbi:Acetamidase/formamidase [Desulfuromusa kysingii]|uniref:Acetamidase/formamidase n=1 Tax=Desulfuromusa kysingii TaxID=37625 RepID=A0A1H3ZV59_9BACT|nr:acetamidase/formamidase family protein [Desulfuromusa kysingii]SEA27550.1 Acetamidase/formamidase [Desulfuromusa kysingii]